MQLKSHLGVLQWSLSRQICCPTAEGQLGRGLKSVEEGGGRNRSMECCRSCKSEYISKCSWQLQLIPYSRLPCLPALPTLTPPPYTPRPTLLHFKHIQSDSYGSFYDMNKSAVSHCQVASLARYLSPFLDCPLRL